ncbi:hypothetical protein FKM82_026240, partial [Ascaphus truei]
PCRDCDVTRATARIAEAVEGASPWRVRLRGARISVSRSLTFQVLEIILSSIVPYVSGPKRPQDRVAVTDMKKDFEACLNEKVGFKGFQIPAEKQNAVVPVAYGSSEYRLSHGCVLIAAVISCTNNCNPSVMLTAGKPGDV